MFAKYINHILDILRYTNSNFLREPSTILFNHIIFSSALLLAVLLNITSILHIDFVFGVIVVSAFFVPSYLIWLLAISLCAWSIHFYDLKGETDFIWQLLICFYQVSLMSLVVFLRYVYLHSNSLRLTTIMLMLGASLGFAVAQLPLISITNNQLWLGVELSHLNYLIGIQMILYTSVLFILSTVILIKYSLVTNSPFMRQDWFKMLIQIVCLVLLTTLLYQIQPNIDYLMRMVYFIPIVWFGYRFGWVGVLTIVIALLISLSVFLYDKPLLMVVEYQPFLVSYLLVSLLLSGMFLEQRLSEQVLEDARASVALSNRKLEEKNTELQNLANSIINIQEEERKLLSQELHDEAAQNITALQIGIKLSENKGSEAFNKTLETVKAKTNIVYNTVYKLVHWLRPRMIDEVGLVVTLESSFFLDRLAKKNIKYEHDIVISDKKLTIELQIAIFRIIQEASLLAMELSSVSVFKVKLREHLNELRLDIYDNRDSLQRTQQVFLSTSSKINYQVLSLNGTYQCYSDKGLTIHISLPLTNELDE